MQKWNYPLTPQAEHVLAEAEKAAAGLGVSYIGTEHLLLGILRTECMAKSVLEIQKVTDEKVTGLVQQLIAPEAKSGRQEKRPLSPKAVSALDEAARLAGKQNQERIGSDHILLALMYAGDCAALRLLNTMEIGYEQLRNELLEAMGADASVLREEEERASRGTSVLERFSRDLTALAASGRLDPVIGREKEIRRLITILSRRTKNNPCLMGEPGVGKTAIVEKLAARMAAGDVPQPLKGKRLLALDLAGMVAGTKYRGEFEERIKRVIAEAGGDSGIILFMDEIHTLIGAGGAEGSLDAANILKPALSRGEVQLVGATTVEEYRKHIEKDAALERRFQPVMVEEPTVAETEEILRGLKNRYENHHGVRILDEAITAAVQMSARYVGDRFLPDKALDVLDEAAAASQIRAGEDSRRNADLAKQIEELELRREELIRTQQFDQLPELKQAQESLDRKRDRLRRQQHGGERCPEVREEDVADVVSGWTKIPLKRLTEKEGERLQKLESVLRKRVIGQEEAVSAVAKAVRRGRMGLSDPGRPVGSFLFLGPTGVGKTELCKALAEAVFGQESAMIRVDMSEYMEKHTVSRLLGSPPGYVGYEEGGQLSEKVRRNPYSLILFDEIEKAHPDVFNVLLQILDDGRVTDAQGRTVNFKNTILIMTSNAGAERIAAPKRLGFGGKEDSQADHERMKSGVMEEVKRLFRPEFLNRIDETIVFRSLTKEDMKEILGILLARMNQELKASRGITFRLRPEAKDYLITRGYDPKYGARPLRRTLQKELEDALAEEMLAGRIHDSDTVNVSLIQGKISLKAMKKVKTEP